LPRKTEQELQSIERLARFLELSPKRSIAVVRTARLYQDALWMSEAEPALSWLLFVSALEVAAGEWRTSQDSLREIMRAARPQLDTLLEESGGAELADRVAGMIAEPMRATKKFIDFCLAFMPPAPDIRPEEHSRIPWTSSYLKRSLSDIYDYRSKALHAGTPFPAPMCMPPGIYGEAKAERIRGGAAGALGGIWVARDLPMFLHVFEYITRRVLLSWWDSLLIQTQESAGGS
jgi:hypothetical protein